MWNICKDRRDWGMLKKNKCCLFLVDESDDFWGQIILANKNQAEVKKRPYLVLLEL